MQDSDRRQQQFANVKPRDPLKVGIIGCGYIAEHHLRFIAATEDAEISALCDPVIINAQRFGKLYNVKNIFSSYVEMLDSAPLDVVHILTPPEYHYSQAQAAIDHGVHVLVEKPCTLYPDEIEKLYEHAEAKGVFLCPDFIQLFHPSFLQAKSLVDSGKLGPVVHMDIHLGVDPNAPELREAKAYIGDINFLEGFSTILSHTPFIWLFVGLGHRLALRSLLSRMGLYLSSLLIIFALCSEGRTVPLTLSYLLRSNQNLTLSRSFASVVAC